VLPLLELTASPFFLVCSIGESHKYFCQPRSVPFAGHYLLPAPCYLLPDKLGFTLYHKEAFCTVSAVYPE